MTKPAQFAVSPLSGGRSHLGRTPGTQDGRRASLGGRKSSSTHSGQYLFSVRRRSVTWRRLLHREGPRTQLGICVNFIKRANGVPKCYARPGACSAVRLATFLKDRA